MSDPMIGMAGISVLVLLFMLRVPIGSALLAVGISGIWLIRPQAVFSVLSNEAMSTATNYSLIILPLFVLMGSLANTAGLNRDLFKAAHAWIGHVRGGLAVSTIIGCASFAALSGSSAATAATMGRATLPEMRRYNYADSLATGAVAAGGTLGILIPPSAGFVLYALMTETSINQLFMAGILPGIMLTLLFTLAISISVRLNPGLAPVHTERASLSERLMSLRNALPLVAAVLGTLGGIYFGVFDVVEASGAGTFFVLVIALLRRRLGWSGYLSAGMDALKSTGAIFYVLIGAFVFKTFIAMSGIPFMIVDLTEASGLSGTFFAYVFLLMIIILGMFLEVFAILILTLPLVEPILAAAGTDMIWYGVMIVITLEMGLISPPVGMNVFVVKEYAEDVPLRVIFRGIWPFWFAMLAALVLLAAIPQIAVFLPHTMY